MKERQRGPYFSAAIPTAGGNRPYSFQKILASSTVCCFSLTRCISLPRSALPTPEAAKAFAHEDGIPFENHPGKKIRLDDPSHALERRGRRPAILRCPKIDVLGRICATPFEMRNLDSFSSLSVCSGVREAANRRRAQDLLNEYGRLRPPPRGGMAAEKYGPRCLSFITKTARVDLRGPARRACRGRGGRATLGTEWQSKRSTKKPEAASASDISINRLRLAVGPGTVGGTMALPLAGRQHARILEWEGRPRDQRKGVDISRNGGGGGVEPRPKSPTTRSLHA